MPVIVWIGAGLAGALVLDRAGSALEDSGDAAVKVAGAAALAAGAYWLYKRGGR